MYNLTKWGIWIGKWFSIQLFTIGLIRMGWIWSGCHQPVNLILLPFPFHFSSATLLFPLIPYNSCCSPSPVFFGFARFALLFRSDFFFLCCSCRSEKKSCIQTAMFFRRTTALHRVQSEELVEKRWDFKTKQKKQTIAVFWSFQEHTHTLRHTL